MTGRQGGAEGSRPAVHTSTDEWLAKISGQLDALLGGGAPTAPPAASDGTSDEGPKDATPQVRPRKGAAKRTTVRGT